MEDEIAAVSAKKEEAVKGQDYENAAKLRDEEKSKREAMETRKKEWADQQTKSHGAVTEDDIAAVISGWTGVPVAQLTEDEGPAPAAPRGYAASACYRPERSCNGSCQGDPPQPCRPARPEAPDRFVPVPRPDRCRQDRAEQGAGRSDVR